MGKYILIVFYNRGTQERPIWNVYGVENLYKNDSLGEFDNQTAAMEKAHSYGAPVIQGTTNSILAVELINKLGNK